MSFPAPSDRHLAREGLAEYLAAGDPTIVPLDGTPPAQLVIEPNEHKLTMRFETSIEELPDLVDYAHFSADATWHAERHWHELVVEGNAILLEAYPLLCLVADRVQHEGVPFRRAVDTVLAVYKELLGSLGRLSDAQEIGLFGELLFLRHSIAHSGAIEALASWRGGSHEEHDFGLADSDVEVKTTTAEERTHWIHGISQLEASHERDLWLLSIQLTSGGVGALSLPELIESVRLSVSEAKERMELESRLEQVGWHAGQAARYKRGFRIRTAPIAFRVDGSFPAITRATLETVGLDVQRFRQVTYQVDLSGLPEVSPESSVLRSFVDERTAQ